MLLDHYELKAEEDKTVFEFISEGPQGKVKKLIQFQPTGLQGFYNLAFGDKSLADDTVLDDKIVTNNRDAEKVLATVVVAVYVFTKYYPDAWIYAEGNTPSRNRLYQMGINKYFDVAESDFIIIGNFLGEWEQYKKGKVYQSLAIQRKKL